MSHLFCFGYGYTASFLAKQLLELRWKISGTYHTADRKEGFVSLFRYGDPELEHILRDASHVLVSIPPSGDDVLARYATALRSAKWVGYLSATSVYGNHEGEWVDETSLTRPAEIQALQDYAMKTCGSARAYLYTCFASLRYMAPVEV